MVVLSPRKTVDAFMRLHDLPAGRFWAWAGPCC